MPPFMQTETWFKRFPSFLRAFSLSSSFTFLSTAVCIMQLFLGPCYLSRVMWFMLKWNWEVHCEILGPFWKKALLYVQRWCDSRPRPTCSARVHRAKEKSFRSFLSPILSCSSLASPGKLKVMWKQMMRLFLSLLYANKKPWVAAFGVKILLGSLDCTGNL